MPLFETSKNYIEGSFGRSDPVSRSFIGLLIMQVLSLPNTNILAFSDTTGSTKHKLEYRRKMLNYSVSIRCT